MQDVKKEIDAAVEAAKGAPVPDSEVLFKHVYVGECVCARSPPQQGARSRGGRAGAGLVPHPPTLCLPGSRARIPLPRSHHPTPSPPTHTPAGCCADALGMKVRGVDNETYVTLGNS